MTARKIGQTLLWNFKILVLLFLSNKYVVQIVSEVVLPLDVEESTATQSFDVSVICQSPLYAKYIEDNPAISSLPLTIPEIEEVLIDVFHAMSEDNFQFNNIHTAKDVLENLQILSQTTTVYKPNEILYDQMWQSFSWRNPDKSFTTPHKAAEFITEIYNIANPSDQIILQNFFTQPLNFDNTDPRFDLLDPNFSDTYEFPSNIQSFIPSEISLNEIIEEAQNLVAWDTVQNKFIPRGLIVKMLQLDRCRNINKYETIKRAIPPGPTRSTTTSTTTTPTTEPTLIRPQRQIPFDIPLLKFADFFPEITTIVSTTKSTRQILPRLNVDYLPEKTTIVSTTKSKSKKAKDCDDLTSSAMTSYTRNLDSNKELVAALNQYSVERQNCSIRIAPGRFVSSLTCLCRVNANFKTSICIRQLFKVERYLISTAYTFIKEFKTAFALHQTVRQFCDELSDLVS